MASMPCLIHTDVSSSAAAAPWSRPSSPLQPGFAARPTKTRGWRRGSSSVRTEVGGGGARGGANCRFKPRNSGMDAVGVGAYGSQCWCDSDRVEQIKIQSTSRYFVRHRDFSKQAKFSGNNLSFIVSPLVLSPIFQQMCIRWIRPFSSMGSNEVTSEDASPPSMDNRDVISEPSKIGSVKTERAVSDSQLSSSHVQPTMTNQDKTNPETQGGTTKQPPLTAREKLRAARVLSRYTESRPSRSELGSRVLDALRETDRGKKRSGLPEAPSNLFDDSKRGLPKQGFTFNFPGGSDMFFIVASFVFISTVMFATTYIVWKAGAIHFNEY
uniref:30S ribosomal protein S16 n=1 Tax=Anthurium amnicola TaxID=1678845 RepID=A0A1D1ZB66_9ARAE